jgi:GNAT superfamily N-acetyltransferase
MGRWRGSADVAYLVPLSNASSLTPVALGQAVEHLHGQGFRTVITAAVGPAERDQFGEAGFVKREALHLLQRDLTLPLPDRPSRSLGLRRATARDRLSILELDKETFEPFWQLDRDGLDEAIGATPVARLRVARDHELLGYAITGQAQRQGYLQRLAISVRSQRTGLGQALVADALHWLRRRHSLTCWVNTQEANEPALRLYTRMGFVPASHQLSVMQREL